MTFLKEYKVLIKVLINEQKTVSPISKITPDTLKFEQTDTDTLIAMSEGVICCSRDLTNTNLVV